MTWPALASHLLQCLYLFCFSVLFVLPSGTKHEVTNCDKWKRKRLHHLWLQNVRISQLSTCRHSLELNDQNRVCPTGCRIPWHFQQAGYGRLNSGNKLW